MIALRRCPELFVQFVRQAQHQISHRNWPFAAVFQRPSKRQGWRIDSSFSVLARALLLKGFTRQRLQPSSAKVLLDLFVPTLGFQQRLKCLPFGNRELYRHPPARFVNHIAFMECDHWPFLSRILYD